MIQSITFYLLRSALTLLIVATLTFALLRFLPGGPFDGERVWPAEVKKNIERRYELDQPLRVQYLHWIRDISHGDLRESFHYLGQPVSKIITQSLPKSALLGVLALALALTSGVLVGCLSAYLRSSYFDHFFQLLTSAVIGLPNYVVASVLILIFSLKLGWFPPALWEDPSSLVLPIFALSTRPWGMITQLTRNSMIQALRSDYIRTAWGKGLSLRSILFKHALKNSLLPVLSILGPLAAHLISGTFLIESVFQIPGMGRHLIRAVLNRDFPLVMGGTLVYGSILIFSNLIMDLLILWADPRTRPNTQ